MNEYSNPAQAQFLNTYIPIPFEQLYKLGAAAKEDVEKAVEKTGAAVSKWSEFQSPSQKDTETWYNATIGRVKPLIEEMSNNMDLMKSAEGRSRMNALINSVDTRTLSSLKQSAESMKERQKLDQEMMVRGLYNPDWHKVDYTSYDTRTQGTFNDLAPLGYKSIKTLAEPYFKGLEKDHYIGRKGAYDLYGTSQAEIENVAKTAFNDIYNTPEAQKHMEVLIRNNPNMTADDAKNELYHQVIQSQQNLVHVNPVLNIQKLHKIVELQWRMQVKKAVDKVLLLT